MALAEIGMIMMRFNSLTYKRREHLPKGKKGRPELVQFPPPTLGGVVILP
jgi:hypothetical protein